MNKKDKYSDARRLYITTDLSLREVSDQLNVSLSQLKKISARESWRLFKNGPAADKNLALIDHVFVDIKFYTDLKDGISKLMLECMDNPKKLEMLNRTYISAEKRVAELMNVRLEEEE